MSTTGQRVCTSGHRVRTGGHRVSAGGQTVVSTKHWVNAVPAALVNCATSTRLGWAPFSNACLSVASKRPSSPCAGGANPPTSAAVNTAAQKPTSHRMVTHPPFSLAPSDRR